MKNQTTIVRVPPQTLLEELFRAAHNTCVATSKVKLHMAFDEAFLEQISTSFAKLEVEECSKVLMDTNDCYFMKNNIWIYRSAEGFIVKCGTKVCANGASINMRSQVLNKYKKLSEFQLQHKEQA